MLEFNVGLDYYNPFFQCIKEKRVLMHLRHRRQRQKQRDRGDRDSSRERERYRDGEMALTFPNASQVARSSGSAAAAISEISEADLGRSSSDLRECWIITTKNWEFPVRDMKLRKSLKFMNNLY